MTTNTVPGISALQCVISSLRDTAHLSDEGGELTDQLRELRDWALSTAAQPPRQAARLLLENARENERMRKEIYALQEALNFWLPCVPGVHSERDERIANDAGLLAGFDGDIYDTAESRGWISVESNTEAKPRPDGASA